MSGGDYFTALFVVLVGGMAVCLLLMGALLVFYGVRSAGRAILGPLR